MGQRSQHYIIARLPVPVPDGEVHEIEHRYVCIAAFHAQWLYGFTAIRCVLRAIEALRDPINVRIIASELKLLDKKLLPLATAMHPGRSDYSVSPYICPYLLQTVSSAFQFNASEGSITGMLAEHPDKNPSVHDNDDVRCSAQTLLVNVPKL